MKKLFTILTLVALTTTVSFAQAQFAATGGLNMANVSGEDDLDADMKIGIHVGVSASFELSDAMTLKTGALYSMKGAQLDMGGETIKFNLSYIEIPANFSFAVSDQMSLMAGPYIGLLMDATMTYDGESEDLEDMAGMDFGINIGAGFAVTEVISINAGYQMGLTSLDEDGDGDAKNTNIHIGMTYSFGDGY
jgi:opacity protein-like surface antigen